MSLSASAPWRRFYGNMPCTIDYPRLTMYQLVAQTAKRVPNLCAYEFMNRKTSFSAFLRRIDRAAAALYALGIRKGDRVLVLPATVPVDNAVMVFQSEGEYYIRKIKLQDGNRALMQWYDYEPRSEVKSLKELTLVGRARRVEFDL